MLQSVQAAGTLFLEFGFDQSLQGVWLLQIRHGACQEALNHPLPGGFDLRGRDRHALDLPFQEQSRAELRPGFLPEEVRCSTRCRFRELALNLDINAETMIITEIPVAHIKESQDQAVRERFRSKWCRHHDRTTFQLLPPACQYNSSVHGGYGRHERQGLPARAAGDRPS